MLSVVGRRFLGTSYSYPCLVVTRSASSGDPSSTSHKALLIGRMVGLMTRSLSCFAIAVCILLVIGCGHTATTDGRGTPLTCGQTLEPEAECGAIAECVWTSDTESACLQICETPYDCSLEETCRRRLKRNSAGLFDTGFVCFPKVEPAETPEAQTSRTEECADRPVESCDRSPVCSAQVALKVFLEDECRKLVPTDCFPHFEVEDPEGIICMPSTTLATREDSPGDLFSFNSWCSPPGFEGFWPQPDDPLFEALFEGEATVWNWSECPPIPR
jgi:hypothetical protein